MSVVESVETPTDFQCPVCGSFYENAQKLLDHFNEDFPQKKDNVDAEYGLQKTLVCMCYNISRLGLWKDIVSDSRSFAHIKYYSEHPKK